MFVNLTQTQPKFFLSFNKIFEIKGIYKAYRIMAILLHSEYYV
jgi:hypothetical protein